MPSELTVQNGIFVATARSRPVPNRQKRKCDLSIRETIRCQNGGEAFDHFLLAMALFRLGDSIAPAKSYEKAVTLIDSPGLVPVGDLKRIYDEAGALLSDTIAP